jgi:hypothetical protein
MAQSKPQRHLAGDLVIGTIKKAIMGGKIVFGREK